MTASRNASREDRSYAPTPQDRARWRAEDEAEDAWAYLEPGLYQHPSGAMVRLAYHSPMTGAAWCLQLPGGMWLARSWPSRPEAQAALRGELSAAEELDRARRAEAARQARQAGRGPNTTERIIRALMPEGVQPGTRQATSAELAGELGESVGVVSALLCRLVMARRVEAVCYRRPRVYRLRA
jgi:hypothetical protein